MKDDNITARIFELLDRIEDIEGLMAHDIDGIKEKLEAWQDGDLNDSYFLNFLNKYNDKLD